MWRIAALTFPDDGWRGPVALALLAAAGLVAWSYAGAAGTRRRGWCVALKLAGLALLALCVLEPQWTTQRVKPGANFLAVLADNSRSLDLTDAGAAAPRREHLKALLDPEHTAWQSSLADLFEVRRYSFDSSLQAAADFSTLDFQGRASGLGAALERLRERFAGRPLAGVVLLSDGNATDLTAGLPAGVESLPPVYPVVVGGDGPARDLAVAKVSVAQTVFEDAPVTIQAEASALGYAGRTVTAQVKDAGGLVVAEQSATVTQPEQRLDFRFQLKPASPGLSFYRLTLDAGQDPPGAPPEATTANNQRVLVVDRGQGPYRLLYVTGRPNWEFKFLNRALAEDPQVELAALLRVAKREPKFDFRGRAGETSNPLFRGFGDQSREEAGSYDQPIIIRINTRDEMELRSGFPRTAEELYGFHAVILDDLEAAFFTPDQAQLVQKFVSERGGGLLMLGGMESFREGGYGRTPIGDALPVSLDRGLDAATPARTASFTFDLDREGWLQPWARLRPEEVAERARLDAMPPLAVLNRISGVKPGASVIAIARDADAADTAPVPTLAVQRFGRGRSASLLVGDLWRWGMKDEAARTDMDKAWRQLVRWLIADVPGRVSLAVEPVEADPNGAVTLQARVRDASFQSVENAAVTIEVEPVMTTATEAGAGKITLTAEPSLDEPGLYEAVFVPKQSGGYRAEARARNAAGAEEGRALAGWASDLDALEFAALTPNRALLEDLARKTGGEVITPAQLDDLARRLPETKAPIMEPVSHPLWHTPWVFLAALACLVAEWGLRRTHGLP